MTMKREAKRQAVLQGDATRLRIKDVVKMLRANCSDLLKTKDFKATESERAAILALEAPLFDLVNALGQI